MPKGVVTSSITLPSLRIVETARYRVGDCRRPERGIRDGDLLRGLVFLARRDAQLRLRAANFVSRLVEQRRLDRHARAPEDSFATRVRIETLADVLVASGVVTKTPQCATCVGSVTTTRTCL